MVKNEIHARLSPEVMEHVRELTRNQSFLTISHTIRWLIDFGLQVVNDDIELQKKNDSAIQLIEQELGVFFARCRDEHDPEDGQLYWFWFESTDESSWRFDPDSTNNQCPVKRFNSREEAIRDCLRERLLNSMDSNTLVKSVLPSLNSSSELTDEDLIDW